MCIYRECFLFESDDVSLRCWYFIGTFRVFFLFLFSIYLSVNKERSEENRVFLFFFTVSTFFSRNSVSDIWYYLKNKTQVLEIWFVYFSVKTISARSDMLGYTFSLSSQIYPRNKQINTRNIIRNFLVPSPKEK